MPKISAVLVAGGSSQRMGGTDKLFLDLNGRTVLERSVSIFDPNPLIAEIIVVTSRENIEKVSQMCARYPKVIHVVEGGRKRNDSVQNGIARCSMDAQYYAIHDAARPFASDELVTRVIRAAVEHGAAAPALHVTDTIKRVSADKFILETPDRDELYAVETPQVFEAECYRQAAGSQKDAFDDCQLVERAGYKGAIVAGEITNIKITNPEDVEIARMIAGDDTMLIGQGYDAHRLEEGYALILGGVTIEHERGLVGHSDADVLAHAVIDALLGAASMGDIGGLFPDTDARYAGANSIALLREAAENVAKKGYRAGNIDATIICQQPRLASYIEAMRANIAEAVGLDIERVSVKATTEEGMGFTGQEQGIAAMAVTMLRPNSF